MKDYKMWIDGKFVDKANLYCLVFSLGLNSLKRSETGIDYLQVPKTQFK